MAPRSKEARKALESIIAEDKPGYVRSMFDSIAQNYDRMNWIMTGGLLAAWHRAFVKSTGLSPGDAALDVCCGTGDLAFLLARRVGPAGSVTGLDFSRNMLDIAKAREARLSPRRKAALAPIDWIQGDALDLPFDDGGEGRGFSCVSMGFALRNVADIGRSLKEMARVARAGGRVVCLEVSRPDNPVLRAGFNLYFFRFVPLIGRLAERRARKSNRLAKLPPYTYLPYSLERLPPPGEILAMMRAAGLANVRRVPLTGGVVSLYIGTKQRE